MCAGEIALVALCDPCQCLQLGSALGMRDPASFGDVGCCIEIARDADAGDMNTNLIGQFFTLGTA